MLVRMYIRAHSLGLFAAMCMHVTGEQAELISSV